MVLVAVDRDKNKTDQPAHEAFRKEVSTYVTWCFMPSQPMWLYQNGKYSQNKKPGNNSKQRNTHALTSLEDVRQTNSRPKACLWSMVLQAASGSRDGPNDVRAIFIFDRAPATPWEILLQRCRPNNATQISELSIVDSVRLPPPFISTPCPHSWASWIPRLATAGLWNEH